MQGLTPLPVPEKGNDLLDVLNADFITALARFPNASWEVSLPDGAGSAKFEGSPMRICLDFTKVTLGTKVVVTGSLNGQPATGTALFAAAPTVIP